MAVLARMGFRSFRSFNMAAFWASILARLLDASFRYVSAKIIMAWVIGVSFLRIISINFDYEIGLLLSDEGQQPNRVARAKNTRRECVEKTENRSLVALFGKWFKPFKGRSRNLASNFLWIFDSEMRKWSVVFSNNIPWDCLIVKLTFWAFNKSDIYLGGKWPQSCLFLYCWLEMIVAALLIFWQFHFQTDKTLTKIKDHENL